MRDEFKRKTHTHTHKKTTKLYLAIIIAIIVIEISILSQEFYFVVVDCSFVSSFVVAVIIL